MAEKVELPPQEELGIIPESYKMENPNGDLGAKPKKPDVIEGQDVLFPPKHDSQGRYILTDLRKEYPELAGIEEFKPLSIWQMYFVWLYASSGSPYNQNETTIPEKRRLCASRSMYVSKHTLRTGVKEDDYLNYVSGVFPEEVNIAIRRMEMFSPNARLKAKLMAEKILEDFMEFLSRDKNEIQDTDERKKHVDMCVKILEEMPKLIKNVEEGYGVRTTIRRSDAENNKGMTLLDRVYEIEARE